MLCWPLLVIWFEGIKMQYTARVCCVLPVQQSSFFRAVQNDTRKQGDDTQFAPWCGSVAAKRRTGRTALHSVEMWCVFLLALVHRVWFSAYSFCDHIMTVVFAVIFKHTVRFLAFFSLYWIFCQAQRVRFCFVFYAHCSFFCFLLGHTVTIAFWTHRVCFCFSSVFFHGLSSDAISPILAFAGTLHLCCFFWDIVCFLCFFKHTTLLFAVFLWKHWAKSSFSICKPCPFLHALGLRTPNFLLRNIFQEHRVPPFLCCQTSLLGSSFALFSGSWITVLTFCSFLITTTFLLFIFRNNVPIYLLFFNRVYSFSFLVSAHSFWFLPSVVLRTQSQMSLMPQCGYCMFFWRFFLLSCFGQTLFRFTFWTHRLQFFPGHSV